ncbi:MAG: DUF4062 domain-containing protein [Nitrospirae bacterium]|nr:DUF4062 domain-containing protein [Nitrospirota bacterium]MBF0533457.1 DUF4062 domain-containing protein [Nitrospirota bacterium]MBF0616019.1 DUF4062 domain-containing protein [Nitrospirota bacterium]
MEETVRVYISSTFDDLKDYRAEVRKALSKIKAQPVGMEDYTAQDYRPVDSCLEDVASCDIYVGIIARRYGDIPDGHSESITELEYRKAVELKIPILIFLLDEKTTDWPSEYCAIDNDKKCLNKLKNELKGNKMIAQFTNRYDLALEVMPAVADYQKKKIIRLQMEKTLRDQYAELSVTDSLKKEAAIVQSLSEKGKMQSDEVSEITESEQQNIEAIKEIVLSGVYNKDKEKIVKNKLKEKLDKVLASGHNKENCIDILKRDLNINIKEIADEINNYLRKYGNNLNEYQQMNIGLLNSNYRDLERLNKTIESILNTNKDSNKAFAEIMIELST